MKKSFVKNGSIVNQELANIAFYGYVRGRFMSDVEFQESYIEEQIGENEIIIPESIVDSFEYWGSMITNFALAELKYETKKCVESDLDCFYDDMGIEWISHNLKTEMMKYGLQAHKEGYDAFVGYRSKEDKQAQKWFTDLLSGQDELINEVNDLLK
jgi:hypothetical protein